MSDLKDFIKAGVHFGHRTSRWSPKMGAFIWGARNKVHLIDVSKTAFLLEHACKSLEKVASEGGKILWVGTKRPAQATIKAAAEQLAMPSVSHRWIGGTLTNFEQVKKAITRLLHLRDIVEKPMTGLKKKEIVRIKKEADRLEKNIGGIIDLKFPPAALVVVDAKKERTAIREANTLKIPVIGIVDTNTNPEGVTVVIPSNDDSPRAITFLLDKLVSATKTGADAFEKRKKEEAEKLRTERAKDVEPAAKKIEKTPEKKVVKTVEKKAIEKAVPKKEVVVKKETAESKSAEKKAEVKNAPVKKETVKKEEPKEKPEPKKPATKEKASAKEKAEVVAKKAPAKKTTTKKPVEKKAAPAKKKVAVVKKKTSTVKKKATTTKKVASKK